MFFGGVLPFEDLDDYDRKDMIMIITYNTNNEW